MTKSARNLRSSPRRFVPSQAYTLVELMVTVAIVGILAGVSIVTFGRNWRDERVKAATLETSAWLEEVRKIAIQKATPCRVTITPADAQLALDPNPDDPAQYCASSNRAALNLRETVQNTSELLLCAADLAGADPASYTLPCTSSQSGSQSLIFTPRGTVTNGLLLKVHMEEANTDRCIAVMDPMGQIRSGRATATGCDFTTAY